MQELAMWVRKQAAERRTAVVVRALEVTGFGAGQYDNVMAVADDGSTSGNVLRGLVDGAIRAEVAPVLADGVGRVVRVRATTSEAEQVGLSCGGTAALVVQPASMVPAELWAAIEAGRSAVLATRIESGDHVPDGVFAVLDDGTGFGSLGSETDAVAANESKALLADERRSRMSVALPDESVLLLDKIVPRTRVVMVGSGELAEALTDVTRALGWLLDVVPDDHDSVAVAKTLGPADALVVTSHHPERGPATLRAALSADPLYIGALGSRRTQAARAERLAELGASEAEIASIHGPVGLDLGGRNPAETALAICAEILAVRSGKAVQGLRDTTGSINS